MHDLHTAFDASVIGATKLTRKLLGELRTSGSIAAFDPLSAAGTPPFTTRVPPGAWPVELLLGETRGDTRVQLARVRFHETTPVRFELALVEGQDPRTLGPGERFGYAVDAGTGCFSSGTEVDGDRLLATLRAHGSDTCGYAVLDGLVAFSAGYGDGFYSSYFGFDAQGQLVSLTTDFSILALDRPAHTPDEAFRRARATELFEALRAQTPRLGGDEHHDVWARSRELAALGEAASHLVPRLVEAIARIEPACDRDDASAPASLELDLLCSTLGRITGDAEGDARLAAACGRLSDEALLRVLSKRRAASTVTPSRGREALEAALIARVEGSHASAALLTQALRMIGRRTPPHPALSVLATRALRETLASAGRDEDPAHASACVGAAVEPYATWHFDARNERFVHPAPQELVSLAEACLTRVDDASAQRSLARMLAAQGATEELFAHAERTGRLELLGALVDDATYGARVCARLRAIAGDRARALDERFAATTRMPDARERCALLLALGLDGFESAVLQLGYLDATVRLEVLEALFVLAQRAPDAHTRQSAHEKYERLRAHAEGGTAS